MRCSRAIFAVAVALALGSICPARADVVIVHVFNFDYSINPAGQPVVDPTIQLGDTIRWVFDATPHTTTAAFGGAEYWNSFSVPLGGTYDHTFTNAGVFWYYCVPHGFDRGDGTAGGMSGTVTVIPAPAAGMMLIGGLAATARRRRPCP